MDELTKTLLIIKNELKRLNIKLTDLLFEVAKIREVIENGK